MVTYLNQGMYDVVEAARLVRASPSRLVTWSHGTRTRPPLVEPSLGELYSFHDLISLYIVARLAKRGVRLKRIANGIEFLARKLGTDRPLAHEGLEDNIATVGRDFFIRHGKKEEWLDAGRHGQGAFQVIVVEAVRQIQYGPDHLAAIWRPREGIWINPKVQAGASCLEPTRIPTYTIYQLIETGEAAVDVAGDYDLAIDDVMNAYQWEHELAQAA